MAEMTMENEKKAQELYIQLQMIQENAKQIYKQLQVAESQLMELVMTSQSLDEFRQIKEKTEIFVPLNSGIFVKAELGKADVLLVNVGANVAVKKDISSTKKLVERQLEQLREVRERMASDLKKLTMQGGMIEEELQKLVSQ